ncbi:MAG: pyruvate kinase [Methylophilaceae bacterium]|nr:MAG: pyruvate kinase [Methylophilaceae bacterium]
MTIRRTKIVATLGPSSTSEEMLARLITAGVNVVRLNFSHGTAEEHIARANIVRSIALKLNRPIGVLCDLQGPKIRIGQFLAGHITLKSGDIFILDANCVMGDQDHVGLDYKALPKEVDEGTILLLDDGRITMQVDRVQGSKIYCVVLAGGILSNNKGINKQGGGLSAEALTEKDKADIKTAVALEADYVAISFPRAAADIHLARRLVTEAGGTAGIVAKIERAEAIDAAEEIILASDAIMVARGDLGVEVGDAAVPGLQKRLITMARIHHKPVITATQMMESMIYNPIPTRAEVSDVANAILDGTDAVMLSAETATGQYPLETIHAVHRVAVAAEKEYFTRFDSRVSRNEFSQSDESIAMATIYIAQRLKIKAIATLTQSGNTAHWLAQKDNMALIYALSPDRVARRKLTLYRSVYPFPIDQEGKNRDEILHEMEEVLLKEKVVEHGDTVIFTFGEPIGHPGGTNTMKILQIGQNKLI